MNVLSSVLQMVCALLYHWSICLIVLSLSVDGDICGADIFRCVQEIDEPPWS